MSRPLVLWMAGMRWDGQEGTEVRLARALGGRADVVWFDPVTSWMTSRTGAGAAPGRSVVAPGVTRVATVGFPGVTRPGLSALGQARLWAAVAAERRRAPQHEAVVLLSDPTGGFPRAGRGPLLYFVTDDWPAGSDMMGVPQVRLERLLRRNAQRATEVAAVSPQLAGSLTERAGRAVAVIANGCDPGAAGQDQAPPVARAGMVGTLNERIDLALLEAVADRSVALLVVGPLTARSADFRSRFARLVERANVRWEGACAASEVPAHLASMSVGLTPYVDNDFNRGSFPLKTLEYLAHGLRVVSTTLPANRWLDTDLVVEACSSAAFADAVVRSLRAPADAAERDRRRRFAGGHSWDARADRLLELVGLLPDPASPPDRTTPLKSEI